MAKKKRRQRRDDGQKKVQDTKQEEKMVILITLLVHKPERWNVHKIELYLKGQKYLKQKKLHQEIT